MTPTVADAYRLLGYVGRANNHMGRATLRMMEHFDDAGTLPASDLWELSGILSDLSRALADHARDIEKGVMNVGYDHTCCCSPKGGICQDCGSSCHC